MRCRATGAISSRWPSRASGLVICRAVRIAGSAVGINPVIGFTAILCIALGAGGAATLNQWWESDLDAGMKRTKDRPIPGGRMARGDALTFGLLLSAFSVMTMGLAVHWLAAGVLLVSIIYYAVIYTMWLKPRTPQNIVIGGGAGAFPPLIGWIAATGEITAMPLLLFAIIFMWTPPHFWALALFVQSDYAKVGIPMMPVVRGEVSTRKQILIYAVLLLPIAIAPWLIGGTGVIYGIAALVLTLAFSAERPGCDAPQRRRRYDEAGKAAVRLQHPVSLRPVRRTGPRPVCDAAAGHCMMPSMTPEEQAELERRRKSRNVALGLLLLFFVVLFYAITIVRMGD